MALEIRREKTSLVYWAHLRGHGGKASGSECQEKEKGKLHSFEGRIREDRIADIRVSKTVPLFAVPPWTLEEASSDLGLMENDQGKSVMEVFIVEVFI